MTKRCCLIAVAIILFPICRLGWSKTEFFPLQDLRPGMKGIGKTCYQGDTPQEFQVEILGIMRGISPGGSGILARFSGGPLEKTGVFEGMSGSPVFIDGKLVGAVAFSFPFPKEAIGGITPISEMVDAFTEKEDLSSGPKVILKKSMLWDYRIPLPDPSARGKSLAIDSSDASLQPRLSPFVGHALMPIATPLSLAGFSAEAIKKFAPQFQALGMTVLQGTGGLSPKPVKNAPAATTGPIEAGGNVVIPLVRGDMDVSAGGTVTYIDGDKLYAFGHMLFDLGFTELPIHKGRALTVFPSLQSSFKILETAEPVGSLRQDRGSGIYGVIGQTARMIPMHLVMSTARGVKKELNYEIARDRFLTPFLVNLTVYNSIIATERSLGVSTLQVKGKIQIKGEQPVEIENRYSSDSNSPTFASLSVALPINFLLASGYKNLDLENVNLEISAVEDDRGAVLDTVRLDRMELKAGETVNLDVVSKKSNGEVLEESYPVKIPADVTPGPISILISDGTNLMAADAREQGDDLIPRDLTQLIRFINNIRKNDRLYVRIFRHEVGAVVKGEGLPGLPPSILSILKSDRSVGGMSPIQTSALMEYELPPSDYVVSGSKVLNLNVKP